VRLFVALDLPADVRSALAAWGRSAVGGDERLRLVAEDSLHVTLVFLGERPDPDPVAATVVAALDPVPEAPPLAVAEALWLSPRRPHVLTAALADPTGGLARLQAAVLGALVREAGHEAEKRAFRPHVTIARVRRRVRAFDVPAPPEARFVAPSVTLYRSVLGRGPAAYEPLASVPLCTLS
jgi:RNA 2',3'-cyclic 3'-phosphodiesterase